MVPPGMFPPAPVANLLVPPGLAPLDLAPPGLAPPGLAPLGLAPPGLAQPAVAAPNGEKLVENYGADCWTGCGGAGGACPAVCGAGNACCRYGSTKDPPECSGVNWVDFPQTHHTCVKKATNASDYILHLGQDCWYPCRGNGYCDWCGAGNACCRYGADTDPAECLGVTFWPTNAHHTCVKAAGKPTGIGPEVVEPNGNFVKPSEGACPPGQVMSYAGTCKKATGPALMTFYMYRAADDKSYHIQSANAANLEGLMWYLQNEVVISCPRKLNISRIKRYVVTMKNPETLFAGDLHSQFGQMVQFDQGRCTWNSSQCSGLWDTYGYAVGCQPMNTASEALPNYAEPNKPAWYSLPGKCPGETYDQKFGGCVFSAESATLPMGPSTARGRRSTPGRFD